MTTRVIRWIRGTAEGKTPLHWNQLKTVPHPAKAGRSVDHATDRTMHYFRNVENPNYVPATERPAGVALKPEQLKREIQQYKYPKALRDEMQDRVDEVITLIQKVALGKVISFLYNTVLGRVQYEEEFEVDGRKVVESESTDDESIVSVCHDLSNLLAEAVSTPEKPVVVAEPEEPQSFETDIAEPE